MTMENGEIALWLKKTGASWPPKRALWLKTEAMQTFRKSYRNYRKGHWKGAKGELLNVIDDSDETQENTKSKFLSDSNGSVDIKDISIFQDGEDPKTIKQLNQLEKYRRAYRQFRTGGCQGAEGEVSKLAAGCTREQLRLLPIAALALCLADQVRLEGSIGPPDSKFHVHFGAGKLGLGLVLPAMVSSNIPFAIIQRPSEAWESILNSSDRYVDVLINEVFVVKLLVIRSLTDLEKTGYFELPAATTKNSLDKSSLSDIPIASELPRLILPAPGTPEAKQFRLLVLCPQADAIVIASAESFSCALGPALVPTLKNYSLTLPLNLGLSRPGLYACENDHGAVDKVREPLEGRLYVKECMVDRICSDRVISKSTIKVSAEPFEGEIVVTARYPGAVKPGFSGVNIFTPTTSGAYSYLYYRKFLLVNGTHTTLAFMTLRQFCKQPADAPGDFELLSPESISENEKLELRAWCVARCLVLLHNHEVKIIKVAHGVETDEDVVKNLWEYAERTLKRFSTIKDTTKRVLGGGVANRYETRLKDILETLETFDKSVPLAYKLFRHTGFKSMSQLKEYLRKLVCDAECFVTLEEPKASKQPPTRYVEGYQRQFRQR